MEFVIFLPLTPQDYESDTNLKITDFGFSRKVHYVNQLRTLCGTAGYIAPEILEKWPAYHLQCDLWSVGVIMYELLGGCSPFGTGSTDEIYERTRKADYHFHPANFGMVSAPAKLLIASLLVINPNRRLSPSGAIDHGWMTMQDELLKKTSLDAQRLRSMTARDKVRTPVASVQSVHRLDHLKDDFSKYMETKQKMEEAKAELKEPVPSALSELGEPFSKFYEIGEEVSTLHQCKHAMFHSNANSHLSWELVVSLLCIAPQGLEHRKHTQQRLSTLHK